MQNIQQVKDNIILKDRVTVIKYILKIKFEALNIQISDNNVKVLSLFLFDSDKKRVIQQALDNKYVNSLQSGENAVTFLVNNKLLDKPARNVRVPSKLVPKLTGDYILAELKMINATI